MRWVRRIHQGQETIWLVQVIMVIPVLTAWGGGESDHTRDGAGNDDLRDPLIGGLRLLWFRCHIACHSLCFVTAVAAPRMLTFFPKW